ncbi:MAG: putative signal transducing protein [Pyrinomonadaceae bacterium]
MMKDNDSTQTESESDNDRQLVKLTSVGSPYEAEMLKNLLEQNGIMAAVDLSSNPFSSLFAATSNQVVVLVNARDRERAEEIHQAYLSGGSSTEEPPRN